MNSIIKAGKKLSVNFTCASIFFHRLAGKKRANFFSKRERQAGRFDVYKRDTFAILMRELQLVFYIYTRFKMLREHVGTRLIYTGWIIFERVDGKRCK